VSISKIISILGHPVFMPLWAFYLSLFFIPELTFGINSSIYLISLVLILSSILFPLLTVFFLVVKERASIEMENAKERSFILFITAFWMTLAYYYLANTLLYSPILKAELLGSIIIIIAAAFISKFWKISLHLLGVGGVLGIFLALEIIKGGMLNLIITLILVSGLLAFARLKEKAHTPAQVYAGFLLGLSLEMIVILNC